MTTFLRFLCLVLLAFGLSLLTGCTTDDVATTFSAIDRGLGTYRNARAAYYGEPYAAPVAQPVYYP